QGWGTFSQTIDENGLEAKFQVKWGALAVQTVRLNPVGMETGSVTVTCSGKPVAATVNMKQGMAVIQLETPVRIPEHAELRVVLAP
uniref:hypothetical protein n=1 Tax=Pontiella sp. TaxID=2837462 RepID=UPI003568F83E